MGRPLRVHLVGLIESDHIARRIDNARLVAESCRVLDVVDGDAARPYGRDRRREVADLDCEMWRFHRSVCGLEQVNLPVAKLEPRARIAPSIGSIDGYEPKHISIERERRVGVADGEGYVMQSCSFGLSHWAHIARSGAVTRATRHHCRPVWCTAIGDRV
jgi:hypothetical protein